MSDVQTIKSGKISALRSDISEKNIIVYTSTCIEYTRIGRTYSIYNKSDISLSYSWNNKADNF